MTLQYVLYEKKDRIACITINRPEMLNALHPPAHRELSKVWADFRDDPEVWVAILTGAGDKAFCAGNDLKYTAEHPTTAHKEREAVPGGFGGITNNFECWKPMIAAINGYALGGGLEIALACDIIIAAEHARMGLPEPRVGLIPGAGGVHRLPRQVPLKIAMGMILTGRHITAQEAYRIGLVNEVVPLKDLMPTAKRWAGEILQCAPLSVRACKETAMKGLDSPLNSAINSRFYSLVIAQQSDDWIEGPEAFAEKRQPQWKGR